MADADEKPIDPHLTDEEIQVALKVLAAQPVQDYTPWELGFIAACLIEVATSGELEGWRHVILANIAAARAEIAEARDRSGATVWSHQHPRALTPEQEVTQAELDVIATTPVGDLAADELNLIGFALDGWAREGAFPREVSSQRMTGIAVDRPAVAQERETTGRTTWEREHPPKDEGLDARAR